MNPARVGVSEGLIEGTEPDSKGVTAFLGVPYAAAPVGRLRFERPRPPVGWRGPRFATAFGNRCVQRRPFSDMKFRSRHSSEDCLFVNVWTPAPGDEVAGLPILFYVHGGGFLVGDGSEPRHDGAALAAHGMVVVTVNYRLGIFGFFAHPELEGTNAGLMDLAAALDWVQTNARAFGGNPNEIAIDGSSSGSFAVAVLLSSPLTRRKVSRAVAQSGAILGTRLAGLAAELTSLEEAQSRGFHFAKSVCAANLDALKSLPAASLLDPAAASSWNRPVIDGELLPRHPYELFEAGEIARVPLLIGCTSAERSFDLKFSRAPSSADAFIARLEKDYGSRARLVYAAYGSPRTEAELRIAGRDLASDEWIGIDSFRFARAASAAGARVYSYVFDHPRPQPQPNSGGWTSSDGAGHSTDIEYFMGTQDLTDVYAWTAVDKALSARMQRHLANFVRTGDPNGVDLPNWPEFRYGERFIFSAVGGTESLAALAKRAELLAGRK